MVIALLSILLTWNIVVFALYGIDKRKAIKDQWRISERTLILSALFFGGFGALLGGKLFHHKTQKWYFQVSWYLGIAIIFVAAYYIYVYFFQK
ncbi:hypothetical protein AT575_04995 [Streptococcus penaeicida]|uniref:DUF1294 domain-containing protein n=2 Tax=Streptococcus TaxID=1301 RepID=A0A2N8LC57_9STRE|nr:MULTISPECIES: DUF1294 domain-containing protein [Streptococcus]OJF72134.1 hypothetical protein A9Q68_00915 [Streptococcus bovimastitidis]PND47753.1 hypothetical protein AT575_04995 [Streptococcus penaeicida]